MGPVQLWFEFASTYSYITVMRIEPLAAARGIPLAWKPFLLGALFNKQGWSDSPFNLFPARGRYMWRDVERQCAKHGIPFRKPSTFPRNSLLAARVACAASGEAWMRDFARAAFRANFADDRNIAEPAVMADALASAGIARERAEEILAAAALPENKERLRRETDLAWESGVFGAPTLIVDGEVFWGNDRVEEAFDWYEARGGKART
jgi:2-hydroxychromene-2-carboxylate isomerase